MRMQIQHNRWLVLLALFLTVTLSGCGMLPTKVPQTAQEYINEANVLLNATAQVIRDNVRSGIMPRSEAQQALNRVKDYAKIVDEASDLLADGKPNLALDKAKLVNGLVSALHKEVSKRAQAQ